MSFYTYVYSCPITLIPRYVGKGKDNRSRQHLSGSKNKSFNGWLNALKANGLIPTISFLSRDLDEETALSLEIWVIQKYGRVDEKTGTLFNHTAGGDGVSGRTPWNKGLHMHTPSLKIGMKWSQKQRENSVNRKRGSGMTGKKQSPKSIIQRTKTRIENRLARII